MHLGRKYLSASLGIPIEQLTGKVKGQWGKLTDHDLVAIAGKREQLEGKLQERLRRAKDEARQDINDLLTRSASDKWRQASTAVSSTPAPILSRRHYDEGREQ